MSLREVEPSDVEVFFEHMNEPGAMEMAAFSPRRDHDEHVAHWKRILDDETVITRTVEHNGRVAGNVVSWLGGEGRLVGYWIGREFWGKGIATDAVKEFVDLIGERPLFAHVAVHNAGSIRVLEKCGFETSPDHPPVVLDGIEDLTRILY